MVFHEMLMALGANPGNENGPKKLPSAQCPLFHDKGYS